MSAGVLVFLYVADPENSPGSVAAAYHSVSRALAGTPGLVGNTLLRTVDGSQSFAVLSEWTDLTAFRTWEEGSGHRGTTAPLRPLQDSTPAAPFCVYEVVASYLRNVQVL
jgi:heme-degrading monooxygenase HmoA